MADDGGVEEQLRVLAGDDVEARAALDPVVALVAEEVSPPSPPRMKSLPVPPKASLPSGPVIMKSCPSLPKSSARPEPPLDDVVALLAVQEIGHADVGAGIGDDVVAVAAMDDVDAVAGLDGVVALVAPHRVVALAGHDLSASVVPPITT